METRNGKGPYRIDDRVTDDKTCKRCGAEGLAVAGGDCGAREVCGQIPFQTFAMVILSGCKLRVP